MARQPFRPNYQTTAAKGGLHQLEKETFRGKFTSKNGSVTYYYLEPIVKYLPTLAPHAFTPDEFNITFKAAFPTYKNTDRKASDMYLAYLQSWGFIQLESPKTGEHDRTYRVISDNDLSRFTIDSEAERQTSPPTALEARILPELREIRRQLSAALKRVDLLLEQASHTVTDSTT